MGSGTLTPEQRARENIDRHLTEAGWEVQNRDETNLYAAQSVAVREFRMRSGHGVVDYLRQPQGPRSGVNAIIGCWPGQESDEEIAMALRELS